MFPAHPTNTNNTTITTLSNTPSTTNNPTRHGRKLSHVQFGKRTYIQDEYASSALMIPFDEMKQKLSITTDSTIQLGRSYSSTSETSSSSEQQNQGEKNSKLLDGIPRTKKRQFINWLFSTSNIGPFTKGDHWPLFTYLMVAFTIVIFSGELLHSKQSSGEFFELEPFNYMLGPSIEIMIQAGARFPPCMRLVDSMPPDQRYICLNTISQNNLTPLAVVAAANKTLPPINHQQSLMLLDPVIDLADPRLLNSSCSLSTICGMTAFHQYRKPDHTYRLLTPLFIHTGLIHLCINMAVLVMLGVKVERTINSLRFSLLYIGSGIFGHALGANFAPPTTPFLGCSSSIFGLVGFLYVDLIMNWKKLEHQPLFYLIKLITCTALCFILGLLPGVDTFSHMGGLIAGVLLGLFLLPVKWWSPSTTTKKCIGLYMTRIISVCLYGLLLGVLIHHFSTSKLDQVCPYCRYISCLPINGFCY